MAQTKIWCYGPETDGANLVVDATVGVQYLIEIKDRIPQDSAAKPFLVGKTWGFWLESCGVWSCCLDILVETGRVYFGSWATQVGLSFREIAYSPMSGMMSIMTPSHCLFIWDGLWHWLCHITWRIIALSILVSTSPIELYEMGWKPHYPLKSLGNPHHKYDQYLCRMIAWGLCNIWWFPKSWGYPQSSSIDRWIFHEINHPFVADIILDEHVTEQGAREQCLPVGHQGRGGRFLRKTCGFNEPVGYSTIW